MILQLALLRGINVGGKNKLPMRDLSALFVEAGCENVRTFIQSGNVVFTAKPRVSKNLGNAISSAIEQRFGLRVPVLLRTAEQLRDVISNNPYHRAGKHEDYMHVVFLADLPESGEGCGARSSTGRRPMSSSCAARRFTCTFRTAQGTVSSPTPGSIPS